MDLYPPLSMTPSLFCGISILSASNVIHSSGWDYKLLKSDSQLSGRKRSPLDRLQDALSQEEGRSYTVDDLLCKAFYTVVVEPSLHVLTL